MDRAKKRRCERALQKIYKRVPDCECKGLCVEACGPVVFCKTEMEKVKDLAPNGWQSIEEGVYMPVIKDAELTCPFLKEGRCSIYNQRPLICRMYGSVENLKCEHGCRTKMSESQGSAIVRDYMKLTEKENEDAGQ